MTFQVHDENIRTPHAVAYLRQLHRELRRPLIVVMDRLNVHRAAVRELRHRVRVGCTLNGCRPTRPISIRSRRFGAIANIPS